MEEGSDMAEQEEPTLEMESDNIPTISLHAINGIDNAEAMRVQGNVGKRQLQVLIDNGSTHDFLDFSMAKKLGWKVGEDESASVQVAGGRSLKVFGCWRGFKWKMQGLEFVGDVRIIELHTYDLVLGLAWLKSIKQAYWDYENLSMHFWYKGELCKLQASPQNSLRVVSSKKLELKGANEQQVFLIQMLQPQGRMNQQCLRMEFLDEGVPVEIQPVLTEFEDVFGDPKGLPPLREGHNHLIILEEGTNPISLKPYRYSAGQKDVIEKQVGELLQNGMLQESASPFSAPIILFKKKDGSWRMCIYYWELNKRTVKNQYPIPLVEDLLDELHAARWFTKLDLKAGYQDSF